MNTKLIKGLIIWKIIEKSIFASICCNQFS